MAAIRLARVRLGLFLIPERVPAMTGVEALNPSLQRLGARRRVGRGLGRSGAGYVKRVLLALRYQLAWVVGLAAM
jgi:hypothetical protein